MRELPGPLGPAGVAAAVLVGLLNIWSLLPAFPEVPAPLLALGTLVVAYGWIFVLRTIVRVLFGGGEPNAG